MAIRGCWRITNFLREVTASFVCIGVFFTLRLSLFISLARLRAGSVFLSFLFVSQTHSINVHLLFVRIGVHYCLLQYSIFIRNVQAL